MAQLRIGPVSLLDVAQTGIAISAAAQLGQVRELAEMAWSWPPGPFLAAMAARIAALPLAMLACALAVKTGLELGG